MNIIAHINLSIGVIAISEVDNQTTISLSFNVLNKKLTKIPVFVGDPEQC